VSVGVNHTFVDLSNIIIIIIIKCIYKAKDRLGATNALCRQK